MRLPSVIGRRALAGAVGLVLILLVAGGLAYRQNRSGSVDDDATAVWCLADTRRAELVQAARVLRVVGPESTTDRLTWPGGGGGAEQWRTSRQADFARTCRVLVRAGQLPAGGGSSSPWASFLPSLVLAVAGAALAAWFGRRSATAGIRRTTADELRTAARAYRLAVDRLLRDLEQPRPGIVPRDDEAQDRRLELAARLNAVAAEQPRWLLPRELSERLDQEPFGSPMAARWTVEPAAQRPAWTMTTRVALGRLDAEVEQVAGAVQDPGLFRRRTPGGTR
ncbi:hypothetical protein [Micromonospora cathayae]|uniref:DUF5129 domain-containing protein n=1 Tax=Micromonospora cathayae TaxID=3028804 RepID=A0ABY7ZV50_9ACTN|nr:hypothetical protein [Micromonospora sp. HUAS 3]WDZ86931.1 hypothetical protein PVK37_11285 [Micromonospora sp. HUAS 3]